jgi:acyl-CoA synthetase (AMP-forming)/AMP-acid ligase II
VTFLGRGADRLAGPDQLRAAERPAVLTFRRTVIGGSACPPAMMDTLIDKLDVHVIHGWGMTEMSPLGTTGGLQAKHLRAAEGSAAQDPAASRATRSTAST